jgi:metal-responsive CopG/Arc/MetJ family transcriptional regulator
MESNEQNNQQEMVTVTMELPRDLVDWIDGLMAQMGFRNRGVIVTQLIRELVSGLDEENEAPTTSTTV